VITISTPKKSKNNPNNRQVKQTKSRESSWCETNCKDVGTCEKYKKYMERLAISHKGKGILCDK